MRKMILCAVLFSTLIARSSTLHASDIGTCEFGKQTITDPLCYGPTNLAETTVMGKMLVAGQFNAQHASMETIEVAGVANMVNSSVKGNTHLTGPLSASDSTFEGNLFIDSDKISFHASSIKGSVIIHSEKENPIVELSCYTKVTGKITFEGEKGIVKKTADSTIEGKVINGTIEKWVSNKKCVPPKVTVLPVFKFNFAMCLTSKKCEDNSHGNANG